MRLKFRILIYKGGRRLRKRDLSQMGSPLWRGIRYITEFKYLEATKWLLIAPDSWEKYALLTLVNLSLGQQEQAREFLSYLDEQTKDTDILIRVEGEDMNREVKSTRDILELMELVLQ
jgi:hypothetical protein